MVINQQRERYPDMDWRVLDCLSESDMGAAGLLDTKVTVSRFKAHLVHVAKTQWVDFHWSPDNAFIEEERRMFPR